MTYLNFNFLSKFCMEKTFYRVLHTDLLGCSLLKARPAEDMSGEVRAVKAFSVTHGAQGGVSPLELTGETGPRES